MYIHLGKNTMLKTDEIIGIFDLDNASVSKRTRAFLSGAQKRGAVIETSYELPKSFVVASKNKSDTRVYLSQLSSETLRKRSGYIDSL